jgi:hypothetical protein
LNSKRLYAWFSFVFLGLLLTNCERNPTQSSNRTFPEIKSLTLNYSQVTKTLFIGAEINDPQGWNDIDRVEFRLLRISSATATSGTLFLPGNLRDDGTFGDIIRQDGVFSYLVPANLFIGNEGYYRVEVIAYDIASHQSDQVAQTVLVQANTPPTLFLLEAPSTFEKGDTLKFRLRVSDLQGYDDIASVIYTVRQPTGSIVAHTSFVLRDDGAFGDNVAGDGIFTVWQPSNSQSKLQGLFTFNFFARDIHNATSDTLKVNVRNPGVTVTYPDAKDTLLAGSTITITWQSAYIDQVKIEYTTNANSSNPAYNLITTMPAAVGCYDWNVPVGTFEHCRVKITDTTNPRRTDTSDQEFIIKP